MKHLAEFYDVLEDVLLETGIRLLNPDYDPNVKWAKGMPVQEMRS